MKKLFCLFLCIVLCGCFVSCSKEPKEISLSKDNLTEYLAVDIVFGEVKATENESSIYSAKYYLTCMATVSVKPKGDYTFTNTNVVCVLDKSGGWTPIKKTGGNRNAYDVLYDWNANIQLDKEGYGETTVTLFCYSNTYNRVHPSSKKWKCYAVSAEGTVTKN